MIRAAMTIAPLALALAACVQEARMAVPPALAAGERVAMTGAGGGRSGDFALGPNRGAFSREETRLGVFDPLYVRRRGGAEFSLQGADFPAAVSGVCETGEDSVSVGIVTVEPGPMRVTCRMSDGSSLTLAASEDGGAFRQATRRGELGVDGRRFALVSVHGAQGGGFETATPLGYALSENGAALAAIDVNGTDAALTLAPGADAAARRAALIATAALGLLEDPADSAL
jgi:hypothetical protein